MRAQVGLVGEGAGAVGAGERLLAGVRPKGAKRHIVRHFACNFQISKYAYKLVYRAIH